METTQESATQCMREARDQRQAIISALYQQRRLNPGQPGITLTDLEQMLKVSKAELEFSLWYLKECGYLVRTDSAKHTITIKGVQFSEALKTGAAKWIDGA